MRWTGKGLSGLCAALLGLSGCWTTDTPFKPPPPPPEYILPPADDPRFSEPPAFPNKPQTDPQPKKDTDGPPGSRNGKMGSGIGGFQ